MSTIFYNAAQPDSRAKAEQLKGCLYDLDISFVLKDYDEKPLSLSDLIVVDEETSQEYLSHAYALGCAVIGRETEIDDCFIHDLCEGYLKRDTWYAKIFPEPIVVSDYGHLDLALGATINPRAVILNGTLDGRESRLTLGRGAHIGSDALLNLGPARLSIGNFTLVSANFSAHAMQHTTSHISSFCIKKGPFDFFGDIYEKAEDIIIGNDVWIGEGVTCLPGVDLADGCVIGAGSIVTRSTEPYGIYAGNPAKFIRYRFDDEKIKILRDSQWWNFPYKKIYALREEFEKDITDLSADVLKGILS